MSGGGPLLLGIDCSTAHLALAVVDPGSGTLAATSDNVGRAHAALVVEALEALLGACGAAARDFAAVGVGVGPGSYAGVRVGVATALGIARAWQVRCAGASSLAAMPAALVASGARVVATSDARRGNVYAQLLERRDPLPWAVSYAELQAPRKLARTELATEYPGVARLEYGTVATLNGAEAPVAPEASALAWRAAGAATGSDEPPKPHYL